jgi:rubrerythrin
MGGKTCLKMLLGKYGILSIEMQDALVADSADFAGDLHHVDVTVVEGPETGGVEGLKARMLAEKGASEAPTQPVAEEKAAEGSPEPPAEEIHAIEATSEPGLYTCTACGWTGDKTARGGKCPACKAEADKVQATADLPDNIPEPDPSITEQGQTVWVCQRNPQHVFMENPGEKCPKCMGKIEEKPVEWALSGPRRRYIAVMPARPPFRSEV